jgi:hypothetical protein
MLGLSELASDVVACAEAGAAGYLSQEATLEDLYSNIWAVAQGEAICSPRVAGFLFSRIAAEARHKGRQWDSGLIHITRRERGCVSQIVTLSGRIKDCWPISRYDGHRFLEIVTYQRPGALPSPTLNHTTQRQNSLTTRSRPAHP